MHSTLAELRLIAGIEASKISFNWEVMEEEYERNELLESFDYALGLITTLETRYTMLMDSGAVPADLGYNQLPSASFSELVLVTDELIAAYVLADLRNRYAAIEAVLA